MGISIYYTGVLRDKNQIEELTREAAEIAAGHHWEYSELPHVPDIPIRGLIVQPSNCDPVWLTFHEDGYLCSPILYYFLQEDPDVNLSEATRQVIVTKTQYAGAEIHMTVINFLRYLDEKYFNNFELTDESEFWETGDDEYCRKRFGEGDHIKDLIELALEAYQTRPENAKEIYKNVKAKLREELGIPKKKV